jgi:SAM-dependent methyltransferase
MYIGSEYIPSPLRMRHPLKFTDTLKVYLQYAPNALAVERSWEIEILTSENLDRPILDLGCGEGIFGKILTTYPIEFGLDPNLRELSRARKLGAYKKLIHANGNNIPLESDSIQTVISNSTLEHIPNLDEVMIEIRRVLKKKGHLYVTLPTDKFDHYAIVSLALDKLRLPKLAIRYRKRFNRFWAHYNFMNPHEWEKYFNALGFEVESKIGYGKKWACVLNELTVPFSIIAFVNKQLFNEWTISNKLKLIYSLPLRKLFEKTSSNFIEDLDKSGLVYFKLVKI